MQVKGRGVCPRAGSEAPEKRDKVIQPYREDRQSEAWRHICRCGEGNAIADGKEFPICPRCAPSNGNSHQKQSV